MKEYTLVSDLDDDADPDGDNDGILRSGSRGMSLADRDDRHSIPLKPVIIFGPALMLKY